MLWHSAGSSLMQLGGATLAHVIREARVQKMDYCKTLNVSVPFISRAKQNREINGHEYQLQAKIGRNYYSISNCMVLIRQNRSQNNFAR